MTLSQSSAAVSSVIEQLDDTCTSGLFSTKKTFVLLRLLPLEAPHMLVKAAGSQRLQGRRTGFWENEFILFFRYRYTV